MSPMERGIEDERARRVDGTAREGQRHGCRLWVRDVQVELLPRVGPVQDVVFETAVACVSREPLELRVHGGR